MRLDEISDCADYHITKGHVHFIGNSLKNLLLIGRDPYRHNSISFFLA